MRPHFPPIKLFDFSFVVVVLSGLGVELVVLVVVVVLDVKLFILNSVKLDVSFWKRNSSVSSSSSLSSKSVDSVRLATRSGSPQVSRMRALAVSRHCSTRQKQKSSGWWLTRSWK